MTAGREPKRRGFVVLALLLVGPFSELPRLPALPDLSQAALGVSEPMVRQRLQAASREVAAKPREAEVNGRFGMLLHAYKQYELALPCYQRARLLEPESFRWVYYLGTLERRLGNQTEAVGTLRKAIQLNPDYVPAQLALGDALLAIGEWEESRKVYAAHLKRYPNSALAHYGLGRIQTARRQPRAAAASFRNALALFPRFGAVHYALAMIYRDLGEPSKSLHHLSVFERNREGIPPVDDPLMGEIEARKVGARYHFSRGVKFQKRGEMRQAAVEFEGALEADPKFAPAHASLLSTYLALGESGRAEEHYYAALRLNPDMYELHHNFGILMSLRGKPDEASKAFRRALEINPLYAESHNNLGFLLADQGRLTEAIRHLRLAIDSKPHFRLPHFRLGQVLLDQGKTPEAIAHLLKTLGVEDEQTPLFLYTLADAYAGAGDSQKAAHYAQQAIARAVPLGQTEVAADVENLLKKLKWAGQELFSQQQDPSVTIYREIAEEAGLNFEHYIGATGEFFLPEIMGSGVALFDYDGDGDLDVYFLQGALLDQKKSPGESVFPPSTDEPPGNKLFRNRLVEDGRLRFDDVTGRAGVGETGYGMGVASGDYDNDGDPDLYVTNFGQNVLYRNNGDGTFTNVASRAGIGHLRWSTSAAFLDYDLDGDLDLFVTNYVDFQVRGNKECANAAGQRDYCNPDAYDPLPDRLFRNQGSGQFVDVTEDSGIGTTFGPGLGVVCADFNSDGWIDIFVANDGSANQLWMNKGDGTFQERALFSGTAYSGGGMAEAGMGVTAGDFDNDGDDDIFLAHLTGETNTLYVNAGAGNFLDATDRFGLGNSSFSNSGFGTQWSDYDNDGRLDLFVANGAVYIVPSLRGKTYPYHQSNQLFVNGFSEIDRKLRFGETTAAAGPALELSEVSRGAAFGDIDNDGDIDIVVANNNGRARLLLNQVGSLQHWLEVRLQGVQSNRFGMGARVGVLREGHKPLWRRAHSDGSYLSAHDPRVHFGLGNRPGLKAVVVQWPGRKSEAWDDVRADQIVTLREGSGRPWPARP